MQSWLIWLALTAAFSLMGLSLAAFQGSVSIESAIVGTSEVAVAFGEHLDTSQDTPRDEEDGKDEVPGQLSETMYHLVIDHEAERNNPTTPRNNKPSFIVKRVGDHEIGISITNAHPGDTYKLIYIVENKGSLPVKCSVAPLKLPTHLKLTNDLDGYIEPGLNSGAANSIKGELIIKIADNAEENTKAEIMVTLQFEQWNLSY